MKTPICLLIFSFTLIFTMQAKQKDNQSSYSLFDNFPIKLGIKYSYMFLSSGASGDEMTASGSKDSGIVKYQTIDSTLYGDSLISWNVVENIDLLRTRKSNYSHQDTTYKVKDSLNIILNEYLSGMHELKCSGTVWKFPINQLRDQIKVPMFRYTDTSKAFLSWKWTNLSVGYVSGSGTDSLFSSLSSGFYKRSFKESWTSGYLWGNYEFTVQSLHDPLKVSDIHILLPKSIQLEQNYPNPFNPSTTIVFQLEKNMFVSLKVFNVLGEEIEILKEGLLLSGEHSMNWNASHLSSGFYFYKLQSKDYTETKKMLLLK